MKNKIKILCPLIQLINDEVSQIIKPGIMNSDKCELIESSFFGFKLLQDPVWAEQFKNNKGAHIPKRQEGTFGDEFKNKWVDFQEEKIDVIILHGSGPTDMFKKIANHYKHKPVINIDYKDVADAIGGNIINDRMFVDLGAPGNIFNFKRSLTVMEKGLPVSLENTKYKIHHAPFCVREDVYQKSKELNTDYSQRDLDVSVFFPCTEKSRDVAELYKIRPNNARGYIPLVVKSLNNLKTHIGYTNGTTKSIGQEGRAGLEIDTPGSTQYKYIQTMCQSKIIVTACPGNYEGDYRLMEAMTSGALVMHNRMMLPPAGLIEGEHWIVYDNAQDLAEKICFYNKYPDAAERIANNGRKFVLENHRPHHRVEQWLKVAGLL